MKCCADMAKIMLLLLAVAMLTAAPVCADTPPTLQATFTGRVDFTGTAGALNSAGDCTVDGSGSAVLSDLPTAAVVRAAYLYWAGSWSEQRQSTATTPDWNITFDGAALTAQRQFTALVGQGRNQLDFFSGVVDVTAQVAAKGNGLYTFGDLAVNTGRPHCQAQAVVAGWSLLVVYEHPDLPPSVVNVSDGFQACLNSAAAVTTNNFQIPAVDFSGRAGFLTWGGDPGTGGTDEHLTFNGHTLANAPFISPADLHLFDVTPYLTAGESTATTVSGTGQDLVLVSAHVLAVSSVELTDLSLTAVPDDPLRVYEAGAIALNISNQGPGDDPGLVTVTLTLPTGLTCTGTPSPSWTVDDLAGPVLVWTHPDALAVGQTLTLDLDVMAEPDAAGTPQMEVTVSGTANDSNPADNTVDIPLNVIIPPAELVSTCFAVTMTDPINGTTNPKAIPGATLVYTLTTSNLTAGAADRNSVEIVNPVPPHTWLFVGDFAGVDSGPILLVDGTPPSGLTLGRGTFGRGNPSLHFSNDGGASFGYTPVPDALGYDAAVTHFMVRPSGIFLGRDAGGPSSFSLKFQVIVQ